MPDVNKEIEEHFQTLQKKLGATLGWLADAPLFIDSDQVARFYDAVVSPQSDGNVVLTLDQKYLSELGVNLKATFPGLLEAGTDAKTNRENSTSIQLKSVTSSQRQLVQLMLHYLTNHRGRMFVVDDPLNVEEAQKWRADEEISKTPRALIFMDLPKFTKLIPTAMELDGEGIKPIYTAFENAPKYPKVLSEGATDTDSQKRIVEMKEYWQWFHDNSDATKTMEIIEKIADKSKIRWIDFRFRINSDGQAGHLHCCPASLYDIGTFAYNVVKRCYNHGLRLVGTLRTEPSVNVLAIYER